MWMANNYSWATEVMKQYSDEALNISRLQFLCQLHCFIALIFCHNLCFIASSLSAFASITLKL
jgi:hypothetical protein